MADRTSVLPVVAIIIGIVGIGLGGYAVVEDLMESDPVIPKASAYVGSAQSLTVSTETRINFTAVSFDSHSAFNLTSDAYTLPEAGYYRIDAQFCVTANRGDFFSISVRQNGVSALRGGFTAAAYSNFFEVSVSGIVQGSAGDVFTVFGYFYNATGPTTRALFANDAYSFFSLAKLP